MLRTLRCSAAALGFGLVLAAGAPAVAAPHGVKTDPNGRFTAEEIHHFLEGFYGNHGPRPWERENLVSDYLKERIAQTPDYDLLLCAQNTPRHIEVGEVTTAQSARVGWATITTSWGQGSPGSFTAYVDLDASRPIKLLDVDCEASAA
ncbi:hypothetical protein [Streptomyces sp. NPDC021212]|uniref:hypothetical protein n=1 Tax=Streptomyces sp. NPDC021212 TaxID=3365118 RepID=UPI003796CE86